jgi:hypothetical protein
MRVTLDARTAAFAGLIDYAGLFPPASLSMGEAVAEYLEAGRGATRWVTGRFLSRSSQLEELAAVTAATLRRGEHPWQIGMIVDMSPGAAAALGREFQREMAPAMSITATEAKLAAPAVTDAGSLIDTLATIDRDMAIFVEVDSAGSMEQQLHSVSTALRDRGRAGGAKLRCGGIDPDAFPSVETVATFIWEATMLSLPFKATAGLHQPIRHHDPDLDVWRHGFVNLLLACAACDGGEDMTTVTRIIGETEPSAFTFTSMAASWRGIAFPGSALRRARRSGMVAYGSCDLAEPIDALVGLGYLGDGS